MSRNREKRERIFPQKLTPAEAEKIVQEINDDRLRSDEDDEHFVVHTNGRKYFIAKHDHIPVDGGSDYIKIKEYLLRFLKELDN